MALLAGLPHFSELRDWMDGNFLTLKRVGRKADAAHNPEIQEHPAFPGAQRRGENGTCAGR